MIIKNHIFIIIILIILIILIFIYFNKFMKIEIYENSEHSDNIQIPKIIIQTWKTNDIPDRYKNLISSIKSNNPDYKYLYFSDNDIDIFLKQNYPEYYETYLKLPVVIQKIDFFRYIAVYHYGGFYFDLDIECYKSLDNLLDNECIFGLDTHLNNSLYKLNRYKPFVNKPFLVGQYAFCAKPHNEFIKLLIDNIHNNINDLIEQYDNLNDKKNLDYVYNTTGPDYVSRIYYDYINDSNKYKIKILDHVYGQYFGNYAKHKYMGTWKTINKNH